MAHTFSHSPQLVYRNAGQDSECESDDDAHMGDDPGAAGANSNGTTDQALRSGRDTGNMIFHRAVRAGDGAALRALRRV